MSQISIIAATFIGNRGAEAMLTTTVNEIRRRKKVRINVYSYYPKIDRLLAEDLSVDIYSATPQYLLMVLCPLSFVYKMIRLLNLKFCEQYFPKSVRALADSDVLIDLAGISFGDGRERYLAYNTISLLPAMILGVPVVKLSQAMGPFRNSINRVAAKLFLPRCLRIFARGKKTLGYLGELGIDKGRYDLAADVAFLQKRGYSMTKENVNYFMLKMEEIREIKRREKWLVGVCPNAVIYKKGGEEYLRALVRMIGYLERRSCGVVIIPNATLPFSKLKNNDLAVIGKLKEKVGQAVVIDRCVNTDQIKEVISLCDFAVVSRFHAMVACLTLKVPPIVVGWSHKYLEVMKEFCLEEWVIDYSEMKGRKMELLIEKMFEERQENKDKIRKKLGLVKKGAERQFEYLGSFLEREL